MKFVGLPRLLRLATVATMPFFLFTREIEGQSFSPRSVFEGKYDVKGTSLRNRNLKDKILKSSKDGKVGKDGKASKANKGIKSAKKSKTTSYGDEDPNPVDINFLPATDLVSFDPGPIPIRENLSCELSLVGSWTYNCGGCDCNKWLVTISCQGAVCSYVEQEYPGDCGLEPEFSGSWESPCTLSGEFLSSKISQTNSTTYGTTCQMSMFEPVVLEAGESCSSEVKQHSHTVKAEFSPALVGLFGSQSMYLHKSEPAGEVDMFQIATRTSDEIPRDPSFCDSCNGASISTVGCPITDVVPFDFSEIINPPDGTNHPSSSPTVSPTQAGIGLCTGQVQSIVNFVADSGTSIITSGMDPATAAGTSIITGFLSLVYDLACQNVGEPTTPQLLAQDVRVIAREEAKEVSNELLLAQLQTLSGHIVAYSNNGGLPIGKLLEYAETANSIENQVARLGVIGIFPMITAANIKIFLLVLLSEYILARSDDLVQCCSLAQDLYVMYTTQLRESFERIRSDLAAYESTKGNYEVYETRAGNSDTSCPSNCMNFGHCCWCAYPWAGHWKGRNGQIAVTSAGRCATVNDSTKVTRINDLMDSLVENFFRNLELKMFPWNVRRLEASVALGVDQTLSCSAN